MQPLVTLKVDPRMKAALKKLADKQFTSVSAVLKQAAEKHLNDNGINWRKEDPKASKE